MKHLRDPLEFVQTISLLRSYIEDRGVLSYLLLHVVQRIWGVDGKTDEDDMRIWIGKRAQTIVVFLACRIP